MVNIVRFKIQDQLYDCKPVYAYMCLYTMQIVKTLIGSSKITNTYFEFALLLRYSIYRLLVGYGNICTSSGAE